MKYIKTYKKVSEARDVSQDISIERYTTLLMIVLCI